jgi:hypothetical protein
LTLLEKSYEIILCRIVDIAEMMSAPKNPAMRVSTVKPGTTN